MRDYKDAAKTAEEDRLRVVNEARSNLVAPVVQGRPDTPPRDAMRKSRFAPAAVVAAASATGSSGSRGSSGGPPLPA
eukprot:1160709-Karenia_brevis.AAC.1